MSDGSEPTGGASRPSLEVRLRAALRNSGWTGWAVRRLQGSHLLYRFYAARALPRLRRVDSPHARALERSMRALVRHRFSPAERAWLRRIEDLRRELSVSPRPLTIRQHSGRSRENEPPESVPPEGRLVRTTIGFYGRFASSPRVWGELLFTLIRGFAPARCVELGTALGMSAAYQAAALELNGGGRLVTLEGAESLAELARQNLEALGLGTVEVRLGRHADILPDVLREHAPVDFAFVDGSHTEAATLQNFEMLLSAAAAGAVLVFDDIHFAPGMERAWRAIAHHPRVAVATDLGRFGIAIVER